MSRKINKTQNTQAVYGVAARGAQDHFRALQSFPLIAAQRNQSKQGRLEVALGDCNREIARKPDDADAYCERGVALGGLKRYEEALHSLERAIQLRPDKAEAFYIRGLVLGELGRHEEALRSYARAIELKPNFAKAYLVAGHVCFGLNRSSDAISNFEKAVDCQPSNAEARFASCMAELPILYEDEADISKARTRYKAKLLDLCADFESGRLTGDLVEAIGEMQPFFLAYQQYCDRYLQTLYGSLVCKIMHREYPVASLPPPPMVGEPVRVGFVSAFFVRHTNWKLFLKGWLSQLDRRRFRLFGYHLGDGYDEETASAAFLCERFVTGLTTVESWREEILADAPHVLIYPGLWMDSLSIRLASQRLAPVQCNSWGHPDTSGMPTFDYFISSELMEPENASVYYSEKLVKLPNLSIYYMPQKLTNIRNHRLELGCSSETKFWCGQSLFKYLPQFDCVFAHIAARVGKCQFVFVRYRDWEEVSEVFIRRLDRAFKLNGLNYVDYCVMLPRLKFADYISAVGHCDVILDSIGWSGGNTTLEYLEHNIPIVTLEGSLMRGRHTAAILRMMGLADTTAKTIEEYVSIAVKLANDPTERAAVSRFIADHKHRIFRDRDCISALEDFIDRVARQEPLDTCEKAVSTTRGFDDSLRSR